MAGGLMKKGANLEQITDNLYTTSIYKEHIETA
jgi:hypothetical protein